MEANELRIGNYYAHNERIEQVTPSVIMEVWDAPRIWCKPIPLTEEWLLKFGFKHYIAGETHEMYTQFGVFEIQKHKTFINGNECKHLQYVHQLQNLYFALTGEELTIKTK